MSLKYGDAVILIQKSRDGDKDVLRRVNAIVLHSASQPENATRSTGLKSSSGALLSQGEYLDLTYPDPGLDGQSISSRSTDQIFRRAYTVAPWQKGAWIGWQAVAIPASDEDNKLRQFLFENYKDQTGNETPQACAIRLLTKNKAKK